MLARSLRWSTAIALGGIAAYGCGRDEALTLSPEAGAAGSGQGGAAPYDASAGAAGITGESGAVDAGLSLFAGPPTIKRYATQPMVVDIELAFTREATASLQVLDDPGVRVAPLTGTEPSFAHTYRLRGLFPGKAHTVRIVATDRMGATEQAKDASFTTYDADPAFSPDALRVVAESGAAPGYRLFDYARWPEQLVRSIYVVDGSGQPRWFLNRPATDTSENATIFEPQLLADGTVLFVQDRAIHVVDELGQETLTIDGRSILPYGFHHGAIPISNGNFLALLFDFRTISYPDGIRLVAGDVVAEVTPEGAAVWTWNSFDHLDPQRTRAGFDGPLHVIDPVTGQPANDWTHGNALVDVPADGTVLLSLRNQDFVLKISRSSSEIVWRLGDGGDFTLDSGNWFYHQHSPELLGDGSLLIYDNAVGAPTPEAGFPSARALRLQVDEAARRAGPLWLDAAPYATEIGGSVREVSGGHVIVVDSAVPVADAGVFDAVARIREVDPSLQNAVVWTLDSVGAAWIGHAAVVSRLPGELP